MNQADEKTKLDVGESTTINFIVEDDTTAFVYIRVEINLQIDLFCTKMRATIEYPSGGELSEILSESFPAEYKMIQLVRREDGDEYESTYSMLCNILYVKMLIKDITGDKKDGLGFYRGGNEFYLDYDPVAEVCKIFLSTKEENMSSDLKFPYSKVKMLQNLREVVKKLETYPMSEEDYDKQELREYQKLLSVIKDM